MFLTEQGFAWIPYLCWPLAIISTSKKVKHSGHWRSIPEMAHCSSITSSEIWNHCRTWVRTESWIEQLWLSGERRGTPWTCRQSITGQHRDKRDKQPHTRSHSLLRTILESPINLTCMFLDGGRKPEYPERTHAYTGRTCRLHTERSQSGDRTSLWGDGANHHTTVQPAYQITLG